MKICTKCKIEKEESFFQWITSKNRHEAQCKKCRKEKRLENRPKEKKERKKRIRKSPEHYKEMRRIWTEKNKEKIKKQVHENYLKNKDSVLLRTKVWRQDNKDKFTQMWKRSNDKDRSKRRARKIVNYHIEKGNLIRPKVCEKCSKEGRIQAHHDDYKTALNIKWLCSSCHAYEHRKYKME